MEDESEHSARDMVERLTTAAVQDDDADKDESLDAISPDSNTIQRLNGVVETPTWSGSLRLYFGTQRTHSLPDLFDFSDPNAEKWDEIWNNGSVSLMREETVLEAQAQGESDGNGNDPSTPISIEED
jgi:hypothetical protein